MTWLDRGSYNRVGVPSVGKVDVPDVLIRLTDPDKCPTRADFEREVRFAIAIADRGIGPAIYATLDVGARRGLAMETMLPSALGSCGRLSLSRTARRPWWTCTCALAR